MSAEMESISITVCGDGGTGKSSISLRLVRSKWTEEYDPTVQDSYSVTRVVDGRTYHLNLTDTAGQEEYRGLWAQQNLDSDAYLLVYDITNKDSLAALEYFNDLVEMQADTRPPGAVPHVKIVAGNKCDLAENRQVKSAEGMAWARANGCGFMETSARNVVNIEETFMLLVRRVVEARESVKNGKQLQSPYGHEQAPSHPKVETSHMDDYDDDDAGGGAAKAGCCSIM
ncbi:ras-domain-containing protein [Ascodesmis nigricans]|uniref:Ras-domain-containing protein n=1 Tax=Ascodesmis nigricans TaxID=341454 RepID=A0A4S2MUK1_9PEZI|nr:ras-domain-containing protein [Ascodesmis nigricans]